MNSTTPPWLDAATLLRRLKHWLFGPVFYLIQADLSPQESVSTELKYSQGPLQILEKKNSDMPGREGKN